MRKRGFGIRVPVIKGVYNIQNAGTSNLATRQVYSSRPEK